MAAQYTMSGHIMLKGSMSEHWSHFLQHDKVVSNETIGKN